MTLVMGYLCGFVLIVFGFMFVELFSIGVSFLIEYLFGLEEQEKEKSA